MTQLTPDKAETALQCLQAIADEGANSLHSPVYFDGLNLFAVQDYGVMAASTVARIANVLEANGIRLVRFDVLKCSADEVLLLKVEPQ